MDSTVKRRSGHLAPQIWPTTRTTDPLLSAHRSRCEEEVWRHEEIELAVEEEVEAQVFRLRDSSCHRYLASHKYRSGTPTTLWLPSWLCNKQWECLCRVWSRCKDIGHNQHSSNNSPSEGEAGVEIMIIKVSARKGPCALMNTAQTI